MTLLVLLSLSSGISGGMGRGTGGSEEAGGLQGAEGQERVSHPKWSTQCGQALTFKYSLKG